VGCSVTYNEITGVVDDSNAIIAGSLPPIKGKGKAKGIGIVPGC